MPTKRVIFVDVDDTLIRSVGRKRIPITATIEFIRRHHALGDLIYCWSRGGADYCCEVATEFGIADCFAAFLPKPDIILDDSGPGLLNHCEFILPSNAANH
jgi:hypothetical protein